MASLRKLNLLYPFASQMSIAPISALAGASRQISSASSESSPQTKPPKRVVFISQSSDVFSNLAFEDWLYKNWSFERKEVLFLWRNSPCVVIGRHQNPWVEANLEYLSTAGVPVARRNSGGGTVYHDHGNLNASFFTARNRYDRRRNLEVLCRALNEDFGVQADINARDDIVVEGSYKVSGTAAKLGRTSAYHHCTLLVNTDKAQLRLALQGDKSIDSKATSSVSSPVKNLAELNGHVCVEKLIGAVGRQFLAGAQHGCSNGYTLVNPTEDWFPGLSACREGLESDAWLYGMTPRFTVARTLPLAAHAAARVTVQSYHGKIESIECPESTSEDVRSAVGEVSAALVGEPFSMDVFNELAQRLRLASPPQQHQQQQRRSSNAF